jgi:hypothetical protein
MGEIIPDPFALIGAGDVIEQLIDVHLIGELYLLLFVILDRLYSYEKLVFLLD